jgi:hypothetical protein
VDDPVRRLRPTDHGRDLAHVELLERRLGAAQEALVQQQVLGRVPGEGELGKHDELSAGGARLRCERLDLGRVAVDVADHGVHLGERNA